MQEQQSTIIDPSAKSAQRQGGIRLCVVLLCASMTAATAVFGVTAEDLRTFMPSLLADLTFGADIDDRLAMTEVRQWDIDRVMNGLWNASTDSIILSDGGLHAAAVDRKTDALSVVGVYLTTNSMKNPDKVGHTYDELKRTGGNAIVFDVKGSYVYFASESALAEQYGLVRPTYDLPLIVAQAHERGLYVIARYIAIKDPVFAQTVKEARLRHPVSGIEPGAVWVDPAHPLTLAYNREIIGDLVKSGVDEINFDYIRFPTEYAPAQIGLTGSEKADRLEVFLRMARSVVEGEKADTVIGISTFAILGWNFELNMEPLGQDVRRLAPLVDVISPMAYPSTFAAGAYYDPSRNPGSRSYWLVYRTLTGYRDILGEEQSYKLRPWIQGYFMTSKGMTDQIKAVLDAGSCGFTVWNATNDYSSFFDALSPSIFDRCAETTDSA